MKILIVSDSHGRHGNLEEVLEKEGPLDMLIHLGDVEGGEDYIEAIADCETHFVCGNNDYFSRLPFDREINIGGIKALITHGHTHYVSFVRNDLVETALEAGVQVAMYGHTHLPMLEIKPDLTVLNPGSISYPRQEGRRPSYIIMTVNEKGDAEYNIKFL